MFYDWESPLQARILHIVVDMSSCLEFEGMPDFNILIKNFIDIFRTKNNNVSEIKI